MAKDNNNKQENFEQTLFKAADKLRKNIDAAEYKHIVLGLIFLKYSSYSFFEPIISNNSQIQTLSRLRDTLLPKLMKGEIRVKD